MLSRTAVAPPSLGKQQIQQQTWQWSCRGRATVATAASPNSQASINGSSSSGTDSSNSGSRAKLELKSGGWNFLFDLRERETEWSEANKARLMALVTAQQLGISMSDMEDRLDALMLLLPDLAGNIPKLHPSLLGGLVCDLHVTSSKMLALRELLPDANISWLVSQRPLLLLQDTTEVAAAVERLKQLLGVERVDKLVEYQPLLLVTECVEEVLADIRRLMPSADAQQLLARDPDWVLRVQRGQKWLGQHPDSDAGELITWTPPDTSASSSSAGSNKAAQTAE